MCLLNIVYLTNFLSVLRNFDFTVLVSTNSIECLLMSIPHCDSAMMILPKSNITIIPLGIACIMMLQLKRYNMHCRLPLCYALA